MSNVTLVIGNRPFTVACADGEEDHVTALGRIIDSKLSTLEALTGQNEVRMLLFAALLLADELDEVRKRTSVVEQAAIRSNVADRLDAIARQMENLAMRLEGSAENA